MPAIHPTAFIAPTAAVMGDVTLGEEASVWYGVVIRADMAPVAVGAWSSTADGAETDAELFRAVNAAGSLALARAARAGRVRRFVLLSTTTVYGDRSHGRKDGELGERDRELHVVLREGRGHERGERDAEREPDSRPDEGGDHALVPHHAAGLPAGHPDRAQHPELARPLVDREDERVHHAEEADHH